MTPALSARVLRLPAPVRAALVTVEGPGWRISRTGNALLQYSPDPHELLDGYAWWPANPAASVAVVLGCPITSAHLRLADLDFALPDDDHEAAICIIEARAARTITVSAGAVSVTVADSVPMAGGPPVYAKDKR